MKPVMIHEDGTDCRHEGTPQLTALDDDGPRCAAGIPVTRIRIDGQVLTVPEAADAFTRLGNAIGEALRPLAETLRAAGEALGRAAAAWVEQNRPALEALGRIAQDPCVRAYAEARKRGEIPPSEPHRPCHCLCGKVHPGEHVCDGEAVTTRRYVTQVLGPVDVQVCAPCLVAAGLAEARS